MTRISRKRSSLRLRLTVLATAAITVTVALVVTVLVATVVQAVRSNVETTLSAYADSVAREGAGGSWPTPLPPAPGGFNAWAQVVDAKGEVIASTSNVAGESARYTLSPGTTTPVPSPSLGPVDERVIAQRYVEGTRPVVIYVGGSTQLLSLLTSDIQGHLLYVLPLVLIGAVGVSWLLIGRTLRPVERMRAEAAEITGSDLHRRVPEPESNDEVGRLARTLNTMLDRLETSASRQRRFVADASHELRTPLAAVRTSLEVGLAHPDQAPWPQLAQRAVAETTRMQRLVEQLLLLARSDADTLEARREPVDLAALARDIAAGAAARVPVEVHADAPLVVTGDPDQLTRLIRNLVDNATRYATTRVDVTVRPDVRPDQPGTVLLQVSDDGPGIPPEDRERVFDRFVRLQASRTRQSGQDSGAGLGLSLVRDIATAHDGTVTAADPGTTPGALFEVRLPAATAS
ncbi:sensor histidine kinase [Streptacidiphilus fuscans]|uniref:histidine kinase n=1 Tax=Streptacidiphilus fuscans TaxID=2789292 RepID=A0A931B4B2_9ACTN|nr:HAMP domain-containing sensor histidine kinase [Streptacidiphilus fuscans]MBF9066645.1 HAMP domain-containing histidine kinase [Streptacidiphilus fuscans]